MKYQSESPITNARVKLVDTDGNAFAIMGRVKKAMKEAGVEQNIINTYLSEAMRGDYDHLLATTMKYVEVE
jgi:hypothetical protein